MERDTPMITGINHITLSVSKLERSLHFYVDILKLDEVVRWDRGAYLLAGDIWVALTLDEKVREGQLPEYTHIAFTVASEDFDAMSRMITNSGATIWQENISEGPSLYFLDPDGHKLEIHASDLEARMESIKRLGDLRFVMKMNPMAEKFPSS